MDVSQLDLFAGPADRRGKAGTSLLDAPPANFIARIRTELQATLAQVRQAAELPWPDPTRATLAELRFNSISAWLPDDEAAALKAAFADELDRLYGLAAQ